ncbi:MAG: nucleotide sugar dehydrogenase [Nanoarchaeota archaeon]|nr:nucleotide sugar dehydrogenase [Nanoarchaeota archaeon]MBU1704764.1 nucleotide sugar dehydrogenase [Nanoarchaeota archaeon]
MNKVCVVGLGYVGLPLAVAFAKHFQTFGYDIDQEKVDKLKSGIDTSKQVEQTLHPNLTYSTDPSVIREANFIVATMPTPIDESHKPDLSAVKAASEIVAKNLSKGSIVVYESTVYPGVTEDICVPILEKHSGLRCGTDFKVGYSPERVNPGDKEHTVETIVKVVSGMDPETLEKVAQVYGTIIQAGVYKAKDIKTAEASKVIENIQRDLNIALVNELSMIFNKMGVDTNDVLDAAGTKWNFHKYKPGLVGGHCIGVDPYYLAHKAQQLGHYPKIILAGRDINEYMSKHVAELTISGLSKAGKVLKDSQVVIMGLTFKENVNDARNSKAKDLIRHLKKFGIKVIGSDPLLENLDQFGIENHDFSAITNCDAVIMLSPHKEFSDITLDQLKSKMDFPVLIDIKSVYDKDEAILKGFIYKRL